MRGMRGMRGVRGMRVTKPKRDRQRDHEHERNREFVREHEHEHEHERCVGVRPCQGSKVPFKPKDHPCTYRTPESFREWPTCAARTLSHA